MTLRNSSGKFSLASFGRKTTNPTLDGPSSPAREQNSNGYFNGPESPSREGGGFFSGGGGGGGGGGGSGSGGVGKKLGKTIAHQSLLPGLGSKETRALQDVITAEKGVLQMTEKLSAETQKAAATLPPLGSQEGPDLQDILTHSSTLLNQLGTAMSVFVDHNANMRGCYKRIREREEELEDLRRRRRSTGQKAESAEKKLAKMGPENKGLPSQTELLERLRGEMRQMDTDIVTEDSKLGDFKRQQIKEALSYKFGGLEELGEKMCIIGELGKLLLEEIPLEETPPGYGRAPYTGYEKTENAVNEATKCLATVKFSAGSAQPRAPGLPPHNPAERLGTPQLPQIGMGHPNGQPQHHDIAAAEEYGNYPGGVSSPEHPQAPFAQDQQRHPSNPSRQASYSLDNTNPYGGIDRSHENHYDEYGGVRSSVAGGDAHVVWQGPTEEALSSHAQAQSQIGQTPHDYEYEQQRRMEEEAAWRATDNRPRPTTDEMPALGAVRQSPQNDHEAGTSRGNPPWQPLNVRKDRSVSPEKRESAGSMAPTLDTPDLGERIASSTYGVPQGFNPPGQGPSQVDNEELALPPRINAFAAGSGSSGPPAAEGFSPVMERDGFYTPRESNTPEPGQFAGGPQSPSLGNSLNVGSQPPPVGSLRLPSPIPPPAAVTSPTASTYSSGPGIGGKISAAAFRKNKPRQSLEPEDDGRPSRRLPQPPGVTGQDTTSQITNDATAGPSHPTTTAAGMSTGLSQIDTSAEDGLYSEAKGEASPPPMYTHPDSLR